MFAQKKDCEYGKYKSLKEKRNMSQKKGKPQKPTYLVLGSIVIGLVVILLVYFIMIAVGLIQVSKNHIVITTSSADKMYDGEALSADGWELVAGELLAGHTIEGEVTGTQTEVGESENFVVITIYDSEGADVTGTYEIEYQLGKLTVHGKKLSFYTESAEKYYDGTPLSCDRWGVYEGTFEQLMTGHEFTAHCSGSLTNVGEADNMLVVSVTDTTTGEDVTRYYDVVVDMGTLKVSAIRLVVSFGTVGSLGPTGGELDTNSVVVSGNLLDGHKVCCKPIDTEISGININTVFIYVVDANGNDVTEYYEIVYPAGDLTLENPETMLPNNAKNLLDTNDYKQMYDKLKEKENLSLEELEEILEESGVADDLPSELAALALTPVYTVVSETDGTLYLRQQSYGDFDGNDWSDPTAYSGVSPYLYANAALRANGYSTTTAMVKPLFKNLKYVLPYYYENGGTQISVSNDICADGLPVTGEYYTVTYVPYEYQYGTLCRIPTELDYEQTRYADFVYGEYLRVDSETRSELIKLAIAAGICDENGTWLSEDIIGAVVEYIRNAATYNLDFPTPPEDENSVLYFLTQSKEGVCRHFAAAATLMYRSLGIPARYVTGFAAQVNAGEETIVTAMMAHAWVEIYVEGFGWLQLEVTGSDANGNSGIQQGVPTDNGNNGNDGSGGNGGSGGSGGSGGTGGGTGGGAGNPSDNGGDKHLMSVMSTQKGPLYLREYSWGHFDGKEWQRIEEDDVYAEIDPFSSVVSALEGNSKATNANLMIKMMAENMPYVLTYYAKNYDSTSVNDCYVEGTYTVEESYRVNYIYYDYITSGGNITNADISADKYYYENYVAKKDSVYLEVDERTLQGYEINGEKRKGLYEILDALDLDGKSDYQKIKAIKEYTQKAASYTLDFEETPEGEDVVLYFLDVAKKGKCWHYATAATMLYRAAGIPARFTTGYMVNITDTSASTEVYSKNAHGWVEVYIRGVGWINVEVTGQELKFDIIIKTPSVTQYYGEVDILKAEQIYWEQFEQDNPGWSSVKENGKTKWVCSNELQEGHWFYQEDVTFGDGLRNVGEKTNSVSITIRDKDGKSVSSMYTARDAGKLTLKPIEVTVRSLSQEFDYDEQGDGYWYNEFEIVSVYAGESNSMNIDAEQLKKMIKIDFYYDENNPLYDGTGENTFIAYVEVNGERADYYKIIPKYGTITVN